MQYEFYKSSWTLLIIFEYTTESLLQQCLPLRSQISARKRLRL